MPHFLTTSRQDIELYVQSHKKCLHFTQPDKAIPSNLQAAEGTLIEFILKKGNANYSPEECRLNLNNKNLSNLDLSRCDLHGARIEGTNFQHSTLVGANLSDVICDKRTQLLGADLTHAVILRTNSLSLSPRQRKNAFFTPENIAKALILDPTLPLPVLRNNDQKAVDKAKTDFLEEKPAEEWQRDMQISRNRTDMHKELGKCFIEELLNNKEDLKNPSAGWLKRLTTQSDGVEHGFY